MTCPDCGNPTWPENTRCLRCERRHRNDVKNLRIDLLIDRETIDSTAFGSRNRQFTIGSLMLVTATFAISLGIYRIAPWLGLIVFIAATSALLRTIMFALGKIDHQRRVSVFDKIDVFLLSFLLSLPAAIVAIIVVFLIALNICIRYYDLM